MKEQGRGVGDARTAVAPGLVVIQIALSLVLVTATGLFLRSFVRLTAAPTGFDADRVLIVNVNAAHAHIEAASRLPLFTQLIQEIGKIPGVSTVGGSTLTPVGGVAVVSFVNVVGFPVTIDSEHAAATNVITPGWLMVYGFQLRGGRDFGAVDTGNGPPVAIVNEAFAHKFFPGEDAIGRAFVGREGPATTIVGLVSDAVYDSVREPMPPAIFLPLGRGASAPTALNISVRVAAGPPSRLTKSISSAITTSNRDLAFSFRELDEQVGASMAQDRIVAALSAFFGMLTLLLAGLGLYGVTVYAVTRRRTEIGIRMALGSPPASIVRLVLSRVTRLVGLGVLVGAGLSLWASKFVASLLDGLEPRDPATLIGAAMTLTAVGALAGWLPAYRASRIDPADVLREG